MKLVLLPMVLVTILSFNLSAQTSESLEHQLPHESHQHELGVAFSPVYFTGENDLATGMHVHYVYNISHSKMGFGLGYERIFDQHKHHTLSLEAVYRPVEKFSVSLSPGLTFEGANSAPDLALHIETAYEFEIGEFHLGPAFEFAVDREDIHLSLGAHLGFGF